MDPTTTPALPPPNGITSNLQNPHNSLRVIWIISLAISLFFPSVLVPLRLYIKTFVMKSLQLVDLFCVLAYLGFVTIASISLSALNDGVGLHAWDVTAVHFAHYLKMANRQEIVYMPTILFTKITILLQLMQIFVVAKRNGRWYFIQTLIWLNTIFFTILMFLEIFQCVPRAKIWNPLHSGVCLNISKTFVATAGVNIVSDLSILVLPLFWVLQLHMPLRRKLGIMAIFCTGIFACISSIMRLATSVRNVNSPDVTYSLAKVTLWAVAEISSGLLVACLPVTPRIFSKKEPKSSKDTPRTHSSGNPSRKDYIEMDETLQPKYSADVESQGSQSQLKSQTGFGGRSDRDWRAGDGQAGEIRKTVSIHQNSGHAKV